jgi:ATP-dependent Lhr-like helicase
LPAVAWERSVLPARIDRYDSSMLDLLCLTGQIAWARLSQGPVQLAGATPVAICRREHHDAWRALSELDDSSEAASSDARRVVETLRARGASFLHELVEATGLDRDRVRQALAELVALGHVSSDGFAGLRSLINPANRSAREPIDLAGRWSAHDRRGEPTDAVTEQKARSLLARYGVIARRLLAREPGAPPWRSLLRVYRWLELRGEIRGGRFVSGMTGEQFALPEAVTRLREVRRESAKGLLLVVSAADPLNLAGILTPGDRVRAVTGSRIVYRDGVPLAVMEGHYIRPLATIDPAEAGAIASALAGRPVPPVVSGYIGRAR